MERLWVKVLVFTGLMGVTGVLWGIYDASLFPAMVQWWAARETQSKAVYAFPAAVLTALFTFWLAAWLGTGSRWRALVVVSQCHLLFNTFLVPACALCLIAHGSAADVIFLGLLFVLGAAAILIMVTDANVHKRERQGQPKTRPHGEWFAVAFVLVALVVVYTAWRRMHGGGVLHELFAAGGLSVIWAFFFGEAATMRFGQGLMDSLVFGGFIGMLIGAFMANPRNSDDSRVQIRAMLGRAAIGFLLGAAVSGLMFGAHAVLFLRFYEVAWNGHDLLISSLWAWGLLGILFGMILACLIHIRTGGPSQMGFRTTTALALIVPPLIAISIWTLGYVRTRDAGRDLLARAAAKEEAAYDIQFCSLLKDEDTVKPRGNILIHLLTDLPLARHTERWSYRLTVEMCDRLLREHPHSAYRSAALYLKFYGCAMNWQPYESLAARRQLDSDYPAHAYVAGVSLSRFAKYSDLMLTGDYKSVLRISRQVSEAGQAPVHPEQEYYAARVEGAWDDAIRICRGTIAMLKEEGYEKAMPKWTEGLRFAEAMKARGAPPSPRTDVTGRIVQVDRQSPGIRICLLPAPVSPSDHPVNSVLKAASRCGRIGTTDESGGYRIQRVPSGEYEVLLILDPERFPNGCNVRCDGLPFKVTGPSVRLPDILIERKPRMVSLNFEP